MKREEEAKSKTERNGSIYKYKQKRMTVKSEAVKRRTAGKERHRRGERERERRKRRKARRNERKEGEILIIII